MRLISLKLLTVKTKISSIIADSDSFEVRRSKVLQLIDQMIMRIPLDERLPSVNYGKLEPLYIYFENIHPSDGSILKSFVGSNITYIVHIKRHHPKLVKFVD